MQTATEEKRRTHHALKGSTIPRTAEVAHRPHSRPKPLHIIKPRQHNRRLDQATREAELVPRLHHPPSILQPMARAPRERDLERAVARRDRRGVVPLLVARRPVVQVDRLPVRVVPRVERPPVRVELVAEDERPGRAGHVVYLRPCGGRGVLVDEAPVAGDRGHLAGRVQPEVERAGRGRCWLREVCGDGVTRAARSIKCGSVPRVPL